MGRMVAARAMVLIGTTRWPGAARTIGRLWPVSYCARAAKDNLTDGVKDCIDLRGLSVGRTVQCLGLGNYQYNGSIGDGGDARRPFHAERANNNCVALIALSLLRVSKSSPFEGAIGMPVDRRSLR